MPGVVAAAHRARSRRSGPTALAPPRERGLRRDRMARAGRRPACVSSARRWPWWPRDTPYVAADGCELVAADYEPLPAVARRGRGARPGRSAPARDAARQRALRSGGTARATWTARSPAAAVRIHETLQPRPLLRRAPRARGDRRPLGGRSSSRVWTGTQIPLVYAHRAGPGLRARGEPRARDRARHRRGLRAEDARDARGHRRGRRWPASPGGPSSGRRRAAKTSPPPRRREKPAWRWRRRPTHDGVLLGLRARSRFRRRRLSHPPAHAGAGAIRHRAILPGPYRTPAYAYDALAIATNKPPLGAYRGVGMAMGAFVMERTLDLLADRLRLDPAEIRRRNLISRDAYPFTSAGGLRLRQRRLSQGARAGPGPGRVRSPRAREGRGAAGAGGSSASGSLATRSTPAWARRPTDAAA